jgi:hypothetical protein
MTGRLTIAGAATAGTTGDMSVIATAGRPGAGHPAGATGTETRETHETNPANTDDRIAGRSNLGMGQTHLGALKGMRILCLCRRMRVPPGHGPT